MIRRTTRRLTRAAAAGLALARAYAVSSGSFAHRGVRFRHTGVLLDQQRAAAIVDKVTGALAHLGHDQARIGETLRRVRVRIAASPVVPYGVPLDVHARWAGGLLDRGEIHVRAGDGWEERLTDALAELLLLEIDPQAARERRPRREHRAVS
jgi:hypothetical protein